jgi:hypothetical protein
LHLQVISASRFYFLRLITNKTDDQCGIRREIIQLKFPFFIGDGSFGTAFYLNTLPVIGVAKRRLFVNSETVSVIEDR